MGLIRAVMSVAFRQNMVATKPAGHGGPLMLFHIETGGCGGCGMELRALASAPYDLGERVSGWRLPLREPTFCL